MHGWSNSRLGSALPNLLLLAVQWLRATAMPRLFQGRAEVLCLLRAQLQ
jgi:hypothetical protein